MTAALVAQLRRLKVTAVMAAMLCILTGCSGSGSSPTPYSCGNVSNGHCYAEVLTEASQFVEGGYRGFITKLNVVSMSSGDGFIDDEMWLINNNSTTCACWIETGYGAFPDGKYYFWSQDVPPGIFANTVLGPITSGDLGGWAQFIIEQASPQLFNILVITPTTLYEGHANNSYLSDPSSPGVVHFGQELAGTSGAVANYAFFEDNMALSDGSWTYITAGDAEEASPPYGGWLAPPSSTNPGGVFLTQCCSPPSSSSAAPAPRPIPRPSSSPSPLPSRPPVGVPAVHVASPGYVPAFSAGEAQAYAIAHTPGTAAVNGKRVAQTTFMTAAQLSAALHGLASGLPADTPVCYVVLNGRFTVEGPPGRNDKPIVVHFRHAFMVFNARTGALLMTGDLPA